MTTLSLLRRHSPLASAATQLRVLSDCQAAPRFTDRLELHGLSPLKAGRVEVLQVNVGRVCNQTCTHCHVDAGPDRREAMSQEVAEACLRALDTADIATLDITGGAPEMNPQFQRLVVGAREQGRRVIDRCNLTILLAPGYTHLPQFLADHQVEVVASLPCYLEDNCDRQRGDGVFRRSIEAIQLLNALGYGKPNSGLPLTLVYNPTGVKLPPDQQALEALYRDELLRRYGIEFTQLHTITNVPISRFLDELVAANRLEDYLETLAASFNPLTVNGLMCRSMISVDWRGALYDCDFNQMLDMGVADGVPSTIFEFVEAELAGRPIVTAKHCFACTAGAGSGCGGSIVE